jgi:septal ring factor EnvC (AmiA/AmiB activator)
MKKIVLSVLTVGFLALPVASFAGGDSVEALRNQLFKLQTSQDNNDKQFKNAFKEIKKVEAQLPKLNEGMQEQLKKMQDNNNKMMKELQDGNEKQLKELVTQLNTLKERLSEKPPKNG